MITKEMVYCKQCQARTIHNKEGVCRYCVELGRAIDDACRAKELYNVDELEQYAKKENGGAWCTMN